MPDPAAPKTRAEIRIAAAAKKHAKARTKLNSLQKAKEEEIRAVSLKWQKRIWPAEKTVYAANAAVTLAQLASHGIMPEQTVIEWKGKLYAVRIKHNGYDVLVPLTKDLREHMGRDEVPTPYKWASVTVTDRVMKGPANA